MISSPTLTEEVQICFASQRLRSSHMPRRKEPRIPDAILDQLLAGADPKTAFDPNGLLDDLKKALAERALKAEMDHHLAREAAWCTDRLAGAEELGGVGERPFLALDAHRALQAQPAPSSSYSTTAAHGHELAGLRRQPAPAWQPDGLVH